MKPLYTLQSIELLIRYGLNYAMGPNDFTINCRAAEGFTVTYMNDDRDYFQVINTAENVRVYIQPSIDVQKEFSFDTIDNNIYAFKKGFDEWVRALHLKQRRQLV
jgi:hypothetical protein